MKAYRYRSAITGRYVSEAFARRNPSTTVKEADKIKNHGRKRPYTQIGITRLPCFRCGNKAKYQWSICADGNLKRPICRECDIELNRMVLEWAGDPKAAQKMAAYRRDA